METFQLRFVGNDATHAFTARPGRFPLQFNDAFVAYTRKTGNTAGQLELFHVIHGWTLVCVDNSYPIIGNPLVLDYDRLVYAIYETIAEINTWPDPVEVVERQNNKEGEFGARRGGHLTLVE